MSFDSYEDLAKAVDSHSHVLSCSMQELRDVHGAGRLGKHVAANISSELERRGLGHVPTELPVAQWDRVRIFRRGTGVARVIDAVHMCDEDNDEVLRQIGGGDASETLKKIRELVCD